MQAVSLFTEENVASVNPGDKLCIAVECAQFIPQMALLFTPKLMQWSSDIWLLDLTPCMSYWRNCFKHDKYRGIVCLFKDVLTEALGKNHSADTIFRAVLAQDPEKALLMIYLMKEKGLHGFVDLDEKFCYSLYRSMPWSVWWTFLREISPRFKQVKLSTQIKQMRAAVRRLGLASPRDLQGVGHAAIGRRFGNVVESLWARAFEFASSKNGARTPCDDFRFPWCDYVIEENPVCQRSLDYPIIEWEHIEPLLREDFNKFCRAEDLRVSDHIISLEWRLVLSDMTSLNIPISFRHPHCLSGEVPQQKTALLQAYYNFFRVADVKFPADNGYPMSPVVSWQLEVTGKLIMPNRILSIFGEDDSSAARLVQLENRLPIALKCYDLESDWLPEDSFHEEAAFSEGADRESYLSLRALSRKRPLFIYNQPQPWNFEEAKGVFVFLERTMAKWWLIPRRLQRDYFRVSDKDGKWLWVYRDNKEKWYIHGIFA